MKVIYKRINHVISIKTFGKKSLADIFNTLQTGVYDPKKFSAVTMKLEQPHVTVIIFSTGNVTVMGCTSYFGVLYALHYLKKKLNLEFINIKLTNIVANINLTEIYDKPIDVYKFFNHTRDCSTFNKEVFPCCSYKMPHKNTKANIFETGSVNIVGSKNKEDMEENIRFVINVIDDFIENNYHISQN